MKRTLWILAILVTGLVILPAIMIVVVGMWLPEDYEATRSLRVAAPVDPVWQIVTDHAAEPAWRQHLERVERADLPDGREAWREHWAGGRSLLLITTSSVAPRRLVRETGPDEGPLRASWELELAPDPAGGTRVTIVERGHIDSPIVRFGGRYLAGHTAFIDAYLIALAQRLGEPPEIR